MDPEDVGKSRIFTKQILERDNEVSVQIIHEFSKGSGLSKSLNSLLMRPFSKLMSTGKPPGKVSYLILRESNKDYLLGAFSYTEKRLLFFPSMKEHQIDKSNSSVVIHNRNYDTQIDHISLEHSLTSSHISFLNKEKTKTRVSSFTPMHITDGFSLWFVWRFKSCENLESLPQTHQLFIEGKPKSEILRRVNEMFQSIRQSRSDLVLADDVANDNYFWNIELFVSAHQESIHTFPGYALHDKTSLVIEDGSDSYTNSFFQIIFSDFEGSVWVKVTKLHGKLFSDHTIISESKEYEESVEKLFKENKFR